jgi:hypothetical protein
MRAILAGLPRGLVIGAGVLTILLSWLVLANILQPLSHAMSCAQDWEAAIAASQAGAGDYQGACLSIGGLDRYREDPSELYMNLESQQAVVDSAAKRFTDRLWVTVGGYLGGFPLIVFATLLGAFMIGSSLASGMTAWSISNGWQRRTWVTSALALIAVLTALGYLMVTSVGGLVLHLRIRGLGIASGIPAPDLEVLAPVSGLLFYGLVAAGIALIVGRGEMAVLLSIGFLTLDYIGSGQFGRAPFFPSSFQSGALGAADAKVGVWSGSLAMLGLTAILALAIYWFFVRRKDLPDR